MNREKSHFFDKERNIDLIVRLLLVICAVLFLADFFYHKHTHFGFESMWGFFAIFGFCAYLAIVLSAKQLRRILKRDEDYYDRDA